MESRSQTLLLWKSRKWSSPMSYSHRFKNLSDLSVGAGLQKITLLDFRIIMIVLEKMATKGSGSTRSCWLIGGSASLWEQNLRSLLLKLFLVPVNSLLVAKYSNLSLSTTAACILPLSLWWQWTESLKLKAIICFIRVVVASVSFHIFISIIFISKFWLAPIYHRSVRENWQWLY